VPWPPQGASSCDWPALTASAPGLPRSRRETASLWQLDGAGIEIGELAAKPTGGRSDTLGTGPGGDVGGERYWLLFHGHTPYLRGSNP
jgi:hypothetical protein